MKYKNFITNMKFKHRMEVIGYPPSIKFCSPSNLGSLVEVEVIRAGWENGTIRWHYLDDKEWDEWLPKYKAAVVAGVLCDEDEGGTGELEDNRADSAQADDGHAGIVLSQPANSMSALLPAPSSLMPVSTATPTSPTTASIPTFPDASAGPVPNASVLPATPVTFVPAALTGTISATATASIPTPATATPLVPTTTAAAIVQSATAPTVSQKRSRSGNDTVPVKPPKQAKKHKDPFINLGGVIDENGRPVAIEQKTRKKRAAEKQPRKKKAQQAVAAAVAAVHLGGAPAASVQLGGATVPAA